MSDLLPAPNPHIYLFQLRPLRFDVRSYTSSEAGGPAVHVPASAERDSSKFTLSQVTVTIRRCLSINAPLKKSISLLTFPPHGQSAFLYFPGNVLLQIGWVSSLRKEQRRGVRPMSQL